MSIDKQEATLEEQNKKIDDLQSTLNKLVNQQEAVHNHDSAFKKITKALAPIFLPSVIQED